MKVNDLNYCKWFFLLMHFNHIVCDWAELFFLINLAFGSCIESILCATLSKHMHVKP